MINNLNRFTTSLILTLTLASPQAIHGMDRPTRPGEQSKPTYGYHQDDRFSYGYRKDQHHGNVLKHTVLVEREIHREADLALEKGSLDDLKDVCRSTISYFELVSLMPKPLHAAYAGHKAGIYVKISAVHFRIADLVRTNSEAANHYDLATLCLEYAYSLYFEPVFDQEELKDYFGKVTGDVLEPGKNSTYGLHDEKGEKKAKLQELIEVSAQMAKKSYDVEIEKSNHKEWAMEMLGKLMLRQAIPLGTAESISKRLATGKHLLSGKGE